MEEQLALTSGKFHCPCCGIMEPHLFSMNQTSFGRHWKKFHDAFPVPSEYLRVIQHRYCSEQKCKMYAPLTHKCFVHSADDSLAAAVAESATTYESPNPSGKRERKLTPKMQQLQAEGNSEQPQRHASRRLDFTGLANEEKKVRLERERLRSVARRAAESSPERKARLEADRERAASRQEEETDEQRESRLKKKREKARELYRERWKQQYLTEQEMHGLSEQLLPQRPSSEHQLKISRAAQGVLLQPNEQICVVCDTFLKPGQKLTQMGVMELPASADVVLKCPTDLPIALAMQYNIEALCLDWAERVRVRKLLLSPRGVGGGSLTETFVSVCSSCMGSLKDTTNQLKSGVDAAKLKPPRWAIANNNFMGVLPPEIAAFEPTAAELAMVAPVFKTAQLVVVRAQKQKGGPGQYRLESHTCSYNMDVEKLIKSLPMKPADVPFRVLITGPRKANARFHVGNRFNVRRGVVRMLLTELKTHNPYYKDISVDEEMLSLLPADAMVEDMVHEDLQDEPDESTAQDTKSSAETDKVTSLDVSSGVLLSHNVWFRVFQRPEVAREDVDMLNRQHTISVSVNEEEQSDQIANLLEDGVEQQSVAEEKESSDEKKEERKRVTVVHHQDTNFVQQHKAGVLEQSFPYLFFYGRGGPSEKRPNQTSLSSLLELYARLSTRAFLGYEWVLHAYDFKARQQMVKQAFVTGNIKVGGGARKAAVWGELSGEDIQLAIRHFRDRAKATRQGKKRPEPPSALPAEAISFLKSLSYCLGEAEHTKEHVDANRTKIFSYMYRFGTPQLWYV